MKCPISWLGLGLGLELGLGLGLDLGPLHEMYDIWREWRVDGPGSGAVLLGRHS